MLIYEPKEELLMRCNTCGYEFDDWAGTCPECHATPEKIQVLSPEERENFDGITIEQDNGNPNQRANNSPFQKAFVFQSSSGGPLAKLIIGGLLLIAVFVFLPLALVLFATLGLNWLSNRSKE
jgi:predicted ATP-dependent serine protease